MRILTVHRKPSVLERFPVWRGSTAFIFFSIFYLLHGRM